MQIRGGKAVGQHSRLCDINIHLHCKSDRSWLSLLPLAHARAFLLPLPFQPTSFAGATVAGCCAAAAAAIVVTSARDDAEWINASAEVTHSTQPVAPQSRRRPSPAAAERRNAAPRTAGAKPGTAMRPVARYIS